MHSATLNVQCLRRYLHDCLQVVEDHYSQIAKKDLSAKVGFEGSEITLNIPEDGETKEGWNITPMTYPVVCSYYMLSLVMTDSGTIMLFQFA